MGLSGTGKTPDWAQPPPSTVISGSGSAGVSPLHPFLASLLSGNGPSLHMLLRRPGGQGSFLGNEGDLIHSHHLAPETPGAAGRTLGTPLTLLQHLSMVALESKEPVPAGFCSDLCFSSALA